MADPPGGEANSDQLFAAILRESTLDVHRMDEVVLSYQLSLRNPEDVNQSHIARIHDAIVASPSPVKSYLQMSLLEALYRLLTGHAHNVSVIVHSPPSGPLLLPDFVASEALNSALSYTGLELGEEALKSHANANYEMAAELFQRASMLLSCSKLTFDDSVRAAMYRSDSLLRLGRHDESDDVLMLSALATSSTLAAAAAYRLLRSIARQFDPSADGGRDSSTGQLAQAQKFAAIAAEDPANRVVSHYYLALMLEKVGDVVGALGEVAAGLASANPDSDHRDQPQLIDALREAQIRLAPLLGQDSSPRDSPSS